MKGAGWPLRGAADADMRKIEFLRTGLIEIELAAAQRSFYLGWPVIRRFCGRSGGLACCPLAGWPLHRGLTRRDRLFFLLKTFLVILGFAKQSRKKVGLVSHAQTPSDCIFLL